MKYILVLAEKKFPIRKDFGEYLVTCIECPEKGLEYVAANGVISTKENTVEIAIEQKSFLKWARNVMCWEKLFNDSFLLYLQYDDVDWERDKYLYGSSDTPYGNLYEYSRRSELSEVSVSKIRRYIPFQVSQRLFNYMLECELPLENVSNYCLGFSFCPTCIPIAPAGLLVGGAWRLGISRWRWAFSPGIKDRTNLGKELFSRYSSRVFVHRRFREWGVLHPSIHYLFLSDEEIFSLFEFIWEEVLYDVERDEEDERKTPQIFRRAKLFDKDVGYMIGMKFYMVLKNVYNIPVVTSSYAKAALGSTDRYFA